MCFVQETGRIGLSPFRDLVLDRGNFAVDSCLAHYKVFFVSRDIGTSHFEPRKALVEHLVRPFRVAGAAFARRFRSSGFRFGNNHFRLADIRRFKIRLQFGKLLRIAIRRRIDLRVNRRLVCLVEADGVSPVVLLFERLPARVRELLPVIRVLDAEFLRIRLVEVEAASLLHGRLENAGDAPVLVRLLNAPCGALLLQGQQSQILFRSEEV